LSGLALQPQGSVVGITLRVNDIQRAWYFYHDLLELDAERLTDLSFRLPNGLVLTQRPGQRTQEATRDILITIEVENFQQVANRVRSSNEDEIVNFEDKHDHQHLRIRDPDGNDLNIVSQ
jgi:hypothetical protein